MAATSTPLSGAYTADPIHSSFGFAVKYQGVSVFRGTLNEVEATLAGGRLEGTAKVESISIRTPEQFRAHVLSGEFFDAENHPEVTFRSTEVELAEDGTARVEGELTIAGTTRAVAAAGTWREPVPAAGGGLRAGLELATVIDRRDFGFEWQMELPNGGEALAYDVTLEIDLQLVQSEQ